MSTPPNSPASPVVQEHDVPTVPLPEPRRRRLNPINTTVGYDEPIHVRVRARMDREIQNMRDATGDISGILEPQILMNQKIDKLTSDLAVTDKVHENLANGCVDMEDWLNTIMSGRGNRRGGQAGGRGGRGNVNMTAAELTTLINERVAEAVTASQATVNAGGAVGLLQWMEKSESAFAMCNCPPNNQVKYASGTLEGPALTWWNSQVQMLTLEMANALPWDEFKTMLREEYCPRDEVQKLEGEFWNLKMEGSEIEAYTTRSHELANLCPQMVTPPYKRIEKFIDGLVPQIQGMVTSSNPTTIQQTIRLAHRLTDQAVALGILHPRGALSKITDNKRKFDSSFPETFQSNSPPQQHQQQHRKLEPSKNNNYSTSSRLNKGSYVDKYPKCNKCNFHHLGACDRYRCHRCGKMGHVAKDCRVDLQNKHAPPGEAPKGCFECGKEGHLRKNCPQLKRNGNGNGNGNNNQCGNGNGNNNQGGNGNNNNNGAKGRAFVIGSGKLGMIETLLTLKRSQPKLTVCLLPPTRSINTGGVSRLAFHLFDIQSS
ncbi:hypothetical protein L1987_39600 [Smallanthus sonchifolius]|uniref:Uncharacterized protein n=1 Tax=Smallanthus sonchifolius TaxID=185202 RepID=A0ACB9HLT9_9ASTR|nr:hypothetical protein L1987_39600 [Smallanthus sonchifolius]